VNREMEGGKPERGLRLSQTSSLPLTAHFLIPGAGEASCDGGREVKCKIKAI
jgi:hypothetical protein